MAKDKPRSAMAALLDFDVNKAVEDNNELVIKELQQPHFHESLAHDEETEHLSEKNDRNNFITAKTIIEIDPFDCIPWRYADRPTDEMGDIDSLAISLKEHGQQEPILVRPNTQEKEYKYEIIFGNRRWRAAKKAKIKLEAICKVVTDQEAAIYQKEENDNRKELSNYARALSYKNQIEGGVFKNESDLSRALGLSKQTLNDIMAYLRVPEEIRDIISNYRNLSKNMVAKLAKYAKEKDTLEVLRFIAPKISDKTVTTSNIDKVIKEYINPKVIVPKQKILKHDAHGKEIYMIEKKNSGKLLITLNKNIAHKINSELLHEKLEVFLMSLNRE